MPERIVIIEPHADDAYLSLHEHIKGWIKEGAEVTIITVFSGTRKRYRDASNYANSVKACWSGLGYIESGGTQEPPAAFDLRAIHAYPGHKIFPLGIAHREHVAISDCAQDFEDVFFYVDAPYHTIQKNKDDLYRAIIGKTVKSIIQPGANKFKSSELFKDQTKFMYFNKQKIIQGMEIVVK